MHGSLSHLALVVPLTACLGPPTLARLRAAAPAAEVGVPTGEPALTIRWFGASTLLFDDGEEQLLVDAFGSRPGLAATALPVRLRPGGPPLESLLQAIEPDRLQTLVVTHTHHDHVMDVNVIAGHASSLRIHGSEAARRVVWASHQARFQLLSERGTITTPRFVLTPVQGAHAPGGQLCSGRHAPHDDPLPERPRRCQYVAGTVFDFIVEHPASSARVFVRGTAGSSTVPPDLANPGFDAVVLSLARMEREVSDIWRDIVPDSAARLPRWVVPVHWDVFWEGEPTDTFRMLPGTPRTLRALHQALPPDTKLVVLQGGEALRVAGR